MVFWRAERRTARDARGQAGAHGGLLVHRAARGQAGAHGGLLARRAAHGQSSARPSGRPRRPSCAQSSARPEQRAAKRASTVAFLYAEQRAAKRAFTVTFLRPPLPSGHPRRPSGAQSSARPARRNYHVPHHSWSLEQTRTAPQSRGRVCVPAPGAAARQPDIGVAMKKRRARLCPAASSATTTIKPAAKLASTVAFVCAEQRHRSGTCYRAAGEVSPRRGSGTSNSNSN